MEQMKLIAPAQSGAEYYKPPDIRLSPEERREFFAVFALHQVLQGREVTIQASAVTGIDPSKG